MMIQSSSLKQFNCPIRSNSIVQFEAIQLFDLKQFNCSVKKKNTHLYIRETQKNPHIR